MAEKCPSELYFYYFIGRLNPPHFGHLSALKSMVEMALRDNSKALILLGSGPKKERTMKDPISYNVKEKFVQMKLREMGESADTYFIQEMGNPAGDVISYVLKGMEGISPDCHSTIHITHVAGGKDEDASKLDFIKSSVYKAVKEQFPNVSIITRTESITPAKSSTVSEDMSATRVRKDAYKCYIENVDMESAFQCFDELYNWFYGEMTREVFDDILYPVQQLELDSESISNYIEKEILPKSSTKKKSTKPASESKKKARGVVRKRKTKAKHKKNKKSKRRFKKRSK